MRRRRHTHNRGRTRPDRLRLLDGLLHLPELAPESFGQRPLSVVDVGYGDSIASSVRLGSVLSETHTRVHLTGVEADPLRVRTAQEHLKEANLPASLDLTARLGGFDLSELEFSLVHMIRCMNVLRGYGIEDCRAAQVQMTRALAPGGVLLEGTSDTVGNLLCCHVWRRRADVPPEQPQLSYAGLLLCIEFASGFAPRMFRDVLPRDLRRHYFKGEPVYDWLEVWQERVAELRALCPGRPDPDVFDQSVVELQNARVLALKSSTFVNESEERRAVLWTVKRPSLRPTVLAPGSLPNPPSH